MSASGHIRDVVLAEVDTYVASVHWYHSLPVRLPLVAPVREVAAVLADACSQALAEAEPPAIACFCELWCSIAPLDIKVRCALDAIAASERKAADGSSDAFRRAVDAALDEAMNVDAFPLSAGEAERCREILRGLVARRASELARRTF